MKFATRHFKYSPVGCQITSVIVFVMTASKSFGLSCGALSGRLAREIYFAFYRDPHAKRDGARRRRRNTELAFIRAVAELRECSLDNSAENALRVVVCGDHDLKK
jgi:hypothetical protein